MKTKPTTRDDSPINSALRQFEATEANLAKLERIWPRVVELTPKGLSFGNDPAYDELVRNYEDIVKALPRIDGWKPEDIPMDLNSIGQLRLDAKEVGEIQAEISIEEQIEAPGRELAKYRHLLNRKRHHLIRSVMVDKINQIDEILQSLRKALPRSRQTTVKSPDWEKLREQVQEIDSLLGGAITRPSRWNDLQRHLHFGMGQDLLDIIRLDWPDVKPGLQKVLYDEDEPIPVEVTDLAALASAQPKGEVITKLKWKSLTDEDFERLIFSIISSTPGYENPEWLIHTKAADRGRDLSVYRVVHDSLSGTIRSRVLIQCRHWLTRSVSTSDVTQLKDQITTWEPPKIDVLIITTTGRFTSDAVSVIEKHNAGDRALKIEMWPESHLEGLLAKRPALIAEFRLR
jgi:hypothetical protein